jgi:hypothetical protein
LALLQRGRTASFQKISGKIGCLAAYLIVNLNSVLMETIERSESKTKGADMNSHTQFYRGTPPPVIDEQADRNLRSAGNFSQSCGRAIYLNQVLLSENEAAVLDRAMRSATPDGSYWYDRLCGAWGRFGGPCLGIIAAGLQLGGPLRADASNGNTLVFVNGRELHFFDVMALHQIMVIMPGRYWLDAYGNFGLEGCRAMGNFWNAAAQPTGHAGGQRRESVLSTWDRTGISVFSW